MLYPRFKPAEAAASKGKVHEQLWSYILRLESAKVDGRAEKARGGIHKSAAERIGEALGGVSGVGEGNGWYSRSRLAGGGVQYLDRGVESVVYDNGNGMVSKVRRITPSSINDMLDILGNIVYHNYLFSNDAYIVRDVVLDSENGIAGLYLVLWQKKVTPKTDPNGNVIAPSYADIFAHLARIPQKLKFVTTRVKRIVMNRLLVTTPLLLRLKLRSGWRITKISSFTISSLGETRSLMPRRANFGLSILA